MPICRVAIAGFGSVGRKTATLLLSRRARYRDIYGVDLRLVAICGSRSGLVDTAGLDEAALDRMEVGKTGPEFIASINADVLIEAGPSDFRTGGPALPYLQDALSTGRDAIVISKGALVHSGAQLREMARTSGAMLKVSGATAAALPTIDLLDYSIRGSAVCRVEGILNATTNYLLDAMMSRGLGFEAALRQAQTDGFAEPNPSNDVDGWDTACKLLILANFGLGADLSMNELCVKGIQDVGETEIDAWRRDGLIPKLIGRLSYEDGRFRGSVAIQTFAPSDPFAHVSGKGKAIRIVTGDMGEIMAISTEAGPTATAAAALKDLEHILTARLTRSVPNRRVIV